MRANLRAMLSLMPRRKLRRLLLLLLRLIRLLSWQLRRFACPALSRHDPKRCRSQ